MPSNPSLAEATRRYNERPSIELKVSNSGAKIANAVVVDPAGRPLYSISSDSKHTKLLMHKDNTEVAIIDWDRSSPSMVFRGKKLKCKEWLQRAGPDTEYVPMPLLHVHHSEMCIRSRILVHGDSRLKWMQRPSQGFVSPSCPTTGPVRRPITSVAAHSSQSARPRRGQVANQVAW